MKKLFLAILSFLLFQESFAQESFQVTRIINFYDKVGMDYFYSAYDSPNARFMPYGRELQQYIYDWVINGELQAYKVTEQFADCSQPMSIKDFEQQLYYYDEAFDEEIQLKPHELYEVIIEEEVNYNIENQSFTYQIQVISLCIPAGVTTSPPFRKIIVRFRYQDLVQLWDKTYKESFKKGMFEQLDCFVQLYEGNTNQVSFTEAFEKRLFQAEILQVFPEEKKELLAQEVIYNPSETNKQGLLELPQFLRITQKKLTTSIDEVIDLRKEAGFFQEENIFLKAIIQGVQAGKITPYHYDYQVGKHSFEETMSLEDFEKALAYYNPWQETSTRLAHKDVYLVELFSKVTIKEGKKLSYQPYQLTIWLPQGINSDSEMGNIRLFSFDYQELANYLAKLKKGGEFVFISDNGKKLSFDKAIEKRLFESEIFEFSNVFDEEITVIIDNQLGDLPEEERKKRVQEESDKVKAYLESLAK